MIIFKTITTPLYYANNTPHIGSAYTTILADTYKRSQQLQNNHLTLLTGTDEHGLKIQRTAIANNVTPQQQVDSISFQFRHLFSELGIELDYFSRTTLPHHKRLVQEAFQKLVDQGDIYLGKQEGWYCTACEEFKTEKGICPIHGTELEWISQPNYFFRLSKYEGAIKEFYQRNPTYIEPETRRNEINSFLSQGLKDFSVSRYQLEWGIPTPIDLEQTIYVWLDALLGYITPLIPENGGLTDFDSSIELQIIGKDISRFHAIYFLGILLALGLPLPKKLFAHGFITKDGKKISKTTGNTINPLELLDRYQSDYIRYYLLKEINPRLDGDFSESRLKQLINSDLANNIGNTTSRLIGIINKYGLITSDRPLNQNLINETLAQYNALDFSSGIKTLISRLDEINATIEKSQPWTLYKENRIDELTELINQLINELTTILYLLKPIIPYTSDRLLYSLETKQTYLIKKYE